MSSDRSSSYDEGFQDGYDFEDRQYGRAVEVSLGVDVSAPYRDGDSDYNQGVDDGRAARRSEGR